MAENSRKRKAQSPILPDAAEPRDIFRGVWESLTNKTRGVTLENKNPEILFKLRSENITVHEPGEVEYERAVAVSNLLYRFTRPICVVQPAKATEVQIVVVEARRLGLSLTIKNGGHSYSGAVSRIQLHIYLVRYRNLFGNILKMKATC